MERITHYKILQEEMLTKDLNFGIFSDPYGRITDTYQIEWPMFYAIFYNDDFSDTQSNQLAYQRIKDSGLHSIAVTPAILTYNDAFKWIVEQKNTKYHSLNDSAGSHMSHFCPKVFTKVYGLKSARQLLNTEFSQSSRTRFNFNFNVEILHPWT